MSFKPNLEAAREAFARRVTEAYLKTWHGYGFIGEEFNEDAAKLLGEQMAKFAFPLTAAPVIVQFDVDTAGIRKAIDECKGHIAQITRTLDDGVVFD
jgi:hypothetical protein